MNDRTADREGLAQAMLDAHRARLGFDPIPLHDCAGPEDYLQPADAILASPQFARIIAEAEARALREAAKAWERGADRARGRNVTAWLRDRAALAAPETEGLT